jgi:predicted dehydrogenase
MRTQIYVQGHGRAGMAVAKSVAMLALTDPELGLLPPVFLERGAPLPSAPAVASGVRNVLAIATPPGLHADAILDAERQGYAAVVVEKPVTVDPESIARLRGARIKTGVLHVYRQTWGVRTLRRLVESGELGDILAVEGRYWQPSTAHRALNPEPGAQNWKNDPRLSGPGDVLLDIACHWTDAATYLVGRRLEAVQGWRTFAMAEAPHRDSFVHLALRYAGGTRGLASVSKAVHGSTNHFELVLHGTSGLAAWRFLTPDEIELGHGRDRRVLARGAVDGGTLQPPFHATGWLEGYVDIIRQVVRHIDDDAEPYPTLPAALDNVEALLATSWTL